MLTTAAWITIVITKSGISGSTCKIVDTIQEFACKRLYIFKCYTQIPSVFSRELWHRFIQNEKYYNNGNASNENALF